MPEAQTAPAWRDTLAAMLSRRMLVALFMGFACGLPLLLTGSAFGWDDYRVIMWVSKQPADFPRFVEKLREMGVNTGIVSAQRPH